MKVFWDVMHCYWNNVCGFHLQWLMGPSRRLGVGDRQKCVCLSVQLLKTIERSAKPVEGDVGLAIIRCAVIELYTD
jgi:hypothetical protein